MLELGQTTTAAEPVKDVTEATFMAEVIEASKTAPVIVDFWAPWCGPCKTLGPALEAAVAAAKGKVRMVKVDVDQNQNIAQQMRVQSIPAVFAFVDGKPVDGFMGAQTPAQLKEFVTKIAALGPDGDGGLDEALVAAEEMLTEGAFGDAVETFAAILMEEPVNPRAIAGLAGAHLAMKDVDKAKAVLDTAAENKVQDPLIGAIRARIELFEATADTGDVGDLRAALGKDPANHQARFDLALALVAAGDTGGAIEELLELFRRDREWNEAAARTQLFKLFDALGPKDELAQKARRRLSSIIYA